ncbi:hypothetical protein D9611_005158 [Ephemerocybe angulata]|uniref:C2H2-type domain-containing protein n=1 Tax=Ephemerocybe angulata TaxID=980116 RepID=A0A8H5BZZ6_9AGAR|nr:hypothetical protein D9611_005158 [Tulosesus angulatus]
MPYCHDCQENFWYQYQYEDHLRESYEHNWCDGCDIDFNSPRALKEHWVQSPRHSYCQRCDKFFDNQGELEDHYDAQHSWCATCRVIFKNDNGLHEHRRQSAAHSASYCAPCRRLFQNPNNLRSHMNSSVHRSKDIYCPGHNCSASFVSQSALILHLEGGRCSSGINRALVNKAVREKDVNNLITDPSRMIAGPGGSRTEVTYCATSAAWNGSAYECYLCHGTYRSLTALNQHLASPRHQDKFYVCPLNTCRERFNTLSGLCQHIESERCGVLKFGPVRQALDGFVSGMKTIRAY